MAHQKRQYPVIKNGNWLPANVLPLTATLGPQHTQNTETQKHTLLIFCEYQIPPRASLGLRPQSQFTSPGAREVDFDFEF